MFEIFHKISNEKTISEKGLLNVVEYTNKASRDIAHLANHNRIAANNFLAYGSILGADLTDVTSRVGNLFIEWSNVLMEFSDVMIQYRDTLKSIAQKESVLQESREQKRKIRENISKIQGSLSMLDKTNALKQQLKQLEHLTEPDEVDLENFKRIATREALYNFLNGMDAMAGKTNVITSHGKEIVDQLDATPIEPGEKRATYTSQEKTKKILEEAKRKVEEWKPEKSKFRRTMTTHYGYNPLTYKPLPPITKDVEQNLNKEETDFKSVKLTEKGKEDKGCIIEREVNEKITNCDHNHLLTSNDNPVYTHQDIIIPNRTISLAEQYRQYTFYKPDEI